MKNLISSMAVAIGCAAITGCVTANECTAKKCEGNRPSLFASFGENVNVPDGMTQDAEGNIYMSVPNYIDKTYAPVIMRRCAKKGKWSIFVQARLNEKTGRAGPMGIELGPDGNLYYCDNQYFFDKDYQSRIMRVVIDKSGAPVKVEPVVTRLKLANAVRFYKDELFFTDSQSDLNDGKNRAGVYRVPMKDFAKGPVKLLDKKDAEKDPYCIAFSYTKVIPERKDNCGCDGLCIDKRGNIFYGTFGDGSFYTAKRKPDGSYAKAEVLFRDPSVWPCCDGICYWPERDMIFMTDSACNAVRTWDIKAKKLGLLWQNDDDNGATGLLDQPCEPMIWKGKLLVVNFDWTFPALRNRENDSYHTVSAIDLK